MSNPTIDYYAILGVPNTATEAEIKAAYYKLIQGAHPDKNPGRPEAKDWAQELNAARDVLFNAATRAEYDRPRAEFKAADASSKRRAETASTAGKRSTDAPRPRPSAGRTSAGAGATAAKTNATTAPLFAALLPVIGAVVVVGVVVGGAFAIVSAFKNENQPAPPP